MPVELTIVESVTELNTTVTTVVLESASAPGPAGVGVPAGGTTGQVLAKASDTDFDTEWATGGSGADDQTAAEVPFTPAGNIAATDVQAAIQELDSEKAAASHAHAGEDITSGTVADARIAATIARDSEVTTAISASEAGQVRDGDAAGGVLSGTYPNPGFASDMATQAELDAHINDATAAHAASAISADSTTLSGTGTDVQAVFEELDNLLDDHSARHENGGADEISLAGLDGTPTALQTHLDDTSDAHDASAISVADSGAFYTATDVEGVLAEIAPQLGGASVVLLEDITLGANTASIDFQSISGDYLHLYIAAIVRGTSAAGRTEGFCRLNNDSGNNYNRQSLRGIGTTASAQTGAGEAQIGQLYFPAASATAGRFGLLEIHIPFYASTTQHKIVRVHQASFEDDTTTNFINTHLAGLWRSTAAVTRVTLFPAADNIVTGSRARLYGIV